MHRYVLRRLAFLLPQMFAVVLITFVIVQLTPGNPARAQLGSQAPEAAVQALERQMGLDRSMPEQFVRYLARASQGNFGVSWVTGKPVAEDLIQRAPVTLQLITLSFIVSLVIAIPLGVATAFRGGFASRVADRVSFIYGLMAGSVPDFWFALILVFVFFSVLGWAPSPIGQLDLTIVPPPTRTGLLLVDSMLAGHWEAFRNHVGHLLLPVATLVFINAAPILRMTRNNVEESLRSEYVFFARANGLPARDIVAYALKNSMLPIITLAGVWYTILIAGAVLTETIFSWGGVGQYAVQAVLNADWAALQAVVLLAGAISLLVYLAVDLLHAWIDPRVRT